MKKISFNISAGTTKLIEQENFANAEGTIIELVKKCELPAAGFVALTHLANGLTVGLLTNTGGIPAERGRSARPARVGGRCM